MKNRRKAVQPFEIKKRKIDISRNYEANGFEKNQRKFENFSTLISKKSKQKALNSLIISEFRAFLNYCLVYMLEHVFNQFRNCLLCCKSYS